MLNSTFNKRRTPPSEDDTEIPSNKRSKTDKTTKPSSRKKANALLTPVSVQKDKVAKTKAKARPHKKQSNRSDGDSSGAAKKDAASPVMGGEVSSEKSTVTKAYGVKVLEGHSSQALYKECYINAITEPNSVAEEVDPDTRIPTHDDFVFAIKEKCVGLSQRDRLREIRSMQWSVK